MPNRDVGPLPHRKLADVGVMDSGPNIRNKISRANSHWCAGSMLRRNRGIIVAIIGLLTGVASLGILVAWVMWPGTARLPTYEWDKTAYSEYQAGGASCKPAAIAALTTDGERSRKRETCEDAKEQHRISTNDLKQQTRAADAAAAAVTVAEWQAKATVLGLVIGLYTLLAAAAAAIFARQAAGETRRGAEAAEQSLAHAVMTHTESVRPWLIFDACETTTIHTQGREILEISAFWLCAGPRPAVVLGSAIEYSTYPVDTVGDPPPCSDVTPRISLAVAPGKRARSRKIYIEGDDFQRFIHHKAVILLTTKIIYTSVSGGFEHESLNMFHLECVGWEDERGRRKIHVATGPWGECEVT